MFEQTRPHFLDQPASPLDEHSQVIQHMWIASVAVAVRPLAGDWMSINPAVAETVVLFGNAAIRSAANTEPPAGVLLENTRLTADGLNTVAAFYRICRQGIVAACNVNAGAIAGSPLTINDGTGGRAAVAGIGVNHVCGWSMAVAVANRAKCAVRCL